MYVLGISPQKIGGIEKFLRYFVIALDAGGWDSVLCFDGPIAAEFRAYVHFPFVALESLDNQGNLGIACASRLHLLLRRYRPRVFVYAFNSVLRCFPWVAKSAGCNQVFFNDHSSRPEGQPATPMGLPKRIVGRLLTAPLTGILSVSDFTRQTGAALKVTSAPNIVIPNGVELDGRKPERRTAFRARWGISDDEVVITQVCWMVKEKGVDVMLHAAALVLRMHSRVRFLFVGDGEALPEFRKLSTELGLDHAAIFIGLVSNPTQMGVYDATDIYCQPSRWQEASALAVLEAMAAHLPVVASNTGGLPENIEDGRSGILVPVGDSEAVAAALERLLNDPSLRHEMGEAGFRVILEGHQIEDVAEKYAAILSDAGRAASFGKRIVSENP